MVVNRQVKDIYILHILEPKLVFCCNIHVSMIFPVIAFVAVGGRDVPRKIRSFIILPVGKLT